MFAEYRQPGNKRSEVWTIIFVVISSKKATFGQYHGPKRRFLTFV